MYAHTHIITMNILKSNINSLLTIFLGRGSQVTTVNLVDLSNNVNVIPSGDHFLKIIIFNNSVKYQ